MSLLPISKRASALVFFLAAAGVIAALFSTLPSPALTAQDADAIAKQLAKMDDDWSAAAATKDANLVGSFYADDCVAYPPNEPVCKGREAATKVWAAYFAEPSLTISWKANYAEAAKSGELGFTAGTYELSVNGPDGTPIREVGKFLCTWKKQKDGSWKAVHDMWNADAK